VKVSNESLRARYQHLEEKEKLTLADVALRCDWETQDKRTNSLKPDSSRVARKLGLVRDNGVLKTEIEERDALKLCRAMHLDPIDIGL
jgi:CHAD domain-containing protein